MLTGKGRPFSYPYFTGESVFLSEASFSPGDISGIQFPCDKTENQRHMLSFGCRTGDYCHPTDVFSLLNLGWIYFERVIKIPLLRSQGFYVTFCVDLCRPKTPPKSAWRLSGRNKSHVISSNEPGDMLVEKWGLNESQTPRHWRCPVKSIVGRVLLREIRWLTLSMRTAGTFWHTWLPRELSRLEQDPWFRILPLLYGCYASIRIKSFLHSLPGTGSISNAWDLLSAKFSFNWQLAFGCAVLFGRHEPDSSKKILSGVNEFGPL